MPSPDNKPYIPWDEAFPRRVPESPTTPESTDPLDRVGNFFGRLARSRWGGLAALGLEGTSISLAAACASSTLQIPAIVRPVETPGASNEPTLIPVPTRTATATAKPPILPTATPTETPQPEKNPASEKILATVPQFKQQHSLTCEASSAAMITAYLGEPVSEETIMANLPRNPDPYQGFRGNIDGPNGSLEDYGVYAEPLANVLQRLGFTTKVSKGHDGWERIQQSIDQGVPVIVWMTFDTQVAVPQQVKLPNGQSVSLTRWEHTVVVVDYDANGVLVNDPYDGKRKYYSNADFLRAWGYFDQMALTIRR